MESRAATTYRLIGKTYGIVCRSRETRARFALARIKLRCAQLDISVINMSASAHIARALYK